VASIEGERGKKTLAGMESTLQQYDADRWSPQRGQQTADPQGRIERRVLCDRATRPTVAYPDRDARPKV
jgi:hypothetical protein